MAEGEEKTRSEEVEEFKENIEEMVKESDRIKETAQRSIENNKGICVDADKIKATLDKQKIVAGTLTKEVADGIPEDGWEHMRTQFNQTARTYRVLYSLRRDMETAGYQSNGFRTVISTSVGSTAASGYSGYSILETYADKNPGVKTALKKVKFLQTWTEDIELIKRELQEVMPAAIKEFESVVGDMSGTGDSELKHKALLSLRSVIFNQIFDNVAPEITYSKTSWFRTAPGGTDFKKKRFCQAKFFIIGSHDESGFPQSMIDAANKTARELFDHFAEMSEFGKEGANEYLVDTCYKQTLTSFANALRLRKEFQKTSP